jgi:hypothetical protein
VSSWRNFLIVGTQRTGSSALGEAVGLHPHIVCGWEWTQHIAPQRKLRVGALALRGDFSGLRDRARDHVKEALGPDTTVLGFRRLFRSSSRWYLHPRWSPALWADRFEAHLQWIASLPQLHIIHVVRRDNLAWLRSKALAAATGRYVGATYPDDMQVTIALRRAIRSVRAKVWVDSRLESLQKTNPYLCISYEDFQADNRQQATQAIRFLGCDPELLPALEMRVQPQSRRDGGAKIVNLEELRQLLSRQGLLEAKLAHSA